MAYGSPRTADEKEHNCLLYLQISEKRKAPILIASHFSSIIQNKSILRSVPSRAIVGWKKELAPGLRNPGAPANTRRYVR